MKTSYPSGHILNPEFKYVPSAQTDIQKTFDRLKREAKAKALGNEKNGTGARVSDIAEAKRGNSR